MRNQALHVRPAAVLLATTCFLVALATPAQSQIIGAPSALDHLKCYHIKDTLQATRYVADLRNQFGLEPGCLIGVPARLFCVETDKQILSSVVPPGGGPSGTAAGHFLCYPLQCPTTSPSLTTVVEDQFGRRPIVLDRARLLCAPADKSICGDGDLDPGEQCDPGSATTNVCPNGSACKADCTCDPPVDCICGAVCTDAQGIVGTCEPTATGNVCTCRPTSPCPCDTTCITSTGEAGLCRHVAGSSLCRCVPPTTSDCECDATCASPDGTAGICRHVPGTDVCRCAPPECPCGATCTADEGKPGTCKEVSGTNQCKCRRNPPECECGERCKDTSGNAGVCQPSATSNVCECKAPPPCVCGNSCITDAGNAGMCQPVPGSNLCRCAPVPDCPCGKECKNANGQEGKCRPVPNRPAGVCDCVVPPPPPACQCGKECKTADGQEGKCRPMSSLPPGVCGCAPR